MLNKNNGYKNVSNKDYFFGINVSLYYVNEDNIDKLIDKILKLGCGWIRLEFDWYSKTNYYLHDKFIKSMHDNNIKILGLLTGLVPGTLFNLFFPHKKFKSPVLHMQSFLKYSDTISKRYSRYITHWEIWNEENTIRFWITKPDYSEYALLLKKTVKIIKQNSRNSKVVLGGIFGNDINSRTLSKPGFIEQLIKIRADKNVDAYAFHPYHNECYLGIFSTKKHYYIRAKNDIDSFVKKYSKHGKEIWITEYGISKLFVFSISYKHVGEIYLEILRYCRKKGILVFFWNIMDMHADHYFALNPERFFGLLDGDLNEKDSYNVLANMISGKKAKAHK